jgi:hypothetical protein
VRVRLWFGFLCCAAFLTACLSDKGPTKSPPDDAPTGPLAAADKLYQQGKCAEAMAAYEGAISKDSTLSAAYQGYYKSTLCFYDVSYAQIYSEFLETHSQNNSGGIALLQHEDATLTRRLQASKRINLVLGRLTDRDTLTRWWRYLDDTVTTQEASDTLYAARRALMIDYLVRADLDMPGYRKANRFPLTDGVVSHEDFLIEFTVFQLTYAITRLYDLDLNDTVDIRDSLMKKLRFGSPGGFHLDSLSTIWSDLQDSVAAVNLNELIGNLGGGSLSGLCNLLTTGCGYGTIDSVILSLDETIMFYQFGDGLDNDGDGCIDEEILDDLDNDLDGFVDEDARVIPADKPDNVDNDHNGRKDPFHAAQNAVNYDSLEAIVGNAIDPLRPHVLGFVHSYLKANNELAQGDDRLTTWVKIKKSATAEEMKIRLAVQRDSLALKVRRAGGTTPDSLAAKIQNARNVIGGCWRNY